MQMEAKPHTLLRPKLSDATSYSEWSAAAQAHDDRSGAARWRGTDESQRYDYKVIRHRLEEILQLRAAADPHEILFYLNEGIHGNMGGMGSSSVYKRAKFGTKDLITDYIRELSGAIEQVADAPDGVIQEAEKLEFFRRASHCFGRSALMLSGAGSLGPFHLGVIKALHEQRLLPTVISGASAGSLVAAVVGTRTNEELEELFTADKVMEAFGDAREEEVGMPGLRKQLKIEQVRESIAFLIPDMTFQEAFEVSGRRINVSISPRALHQQSRLMNAVTSPNVFVREAVMASCAVPGVYPPVTLAARNAQGLRRPYVPSRQWVDGSMTNDLPKRQLIRLYGVNHFITSQTNPIVLWSLRDSQAQDSLFSKLFEINQNASREWLKATYPFAMEVTKGLYPLNLITRMAYSVATQDNPAVVNIRPARRFLYPSMFLALLTEK
jgi:TAG lipase/steryl ester hydrolase/phospholipase A2/LPA acyltransferase